MRLPPFQYTRPGTLEEALGLARKEGAFVIAGGTDAVPRLKRRQLVPSSVISLSRAAGLQGMEFRQGRLFIGAGMTLSALIASPDIKPYSALLEALVSVASPEIRNRATLGGNICQSTRCLYFDQSPLWREAAGHCLRSGGESCRLAPGGARCWAAYCGDTAPALMALDAVFHLRNPGAAKTIPSAEFFRDDGMVHLQIGRGELLTEIELPPPSGFSLYWKARPRRALDYPELGLAVWVSEKNASPSTIRLAVTGMDSRPLRLHGAEEHIRRHGFSNPGALWECARNAVHPLEATAFSPWLKKRLLRHFLTEKLPEVLAA